MSVNVQRRIYILAFLLFVAIIAYLYSGKSKKVEVIQSSTKNDLIKISVSIPRFNNLNNQRFQEELNTSIENKVRAFVEEIRKIAEPGEKENIKTTPYEAIVETQIHYQDKNLISLKIYYYQFTGGAHGITTFETYNVDVLNSRILTLKDILSKDAESVLKEEIIRKVKSEIEYYFPEAIDYILKDDIYNRFFVFDDKYLIIFYTHYEIAPYSTGIPEFPISWDLLYRYVTKDQIRKIIK